MTTDALNTVIRRLQDAAVACGRPMPRLLAVAKTQPAPAVAALAAAGQSAFGENYVQEAAARQAALGPRADGLEWHLIGHLQSNKAREAAALFDWVQSVDRLKLVGALARHRDPERGRLNVLVQVNIDDEASKHGCRPDEVEMLASSIAAEPTLRLRGLMVIPAPHADPAGAAPAFRRARGLFEAMQARHPQVDTLSMGMSADAEVAVAEGSTMVRIGTALFGPRQPR